MKKLFVSVPMRGRKEEDIMHSIAEMKKIAEIAFGEELELIESYTKDDPPKNSNEAIWRLGKSIELLSQADYFIGINNYAFRGCCTENNVASRYDMPMLLIDEEDYCFLKDVCELERDK